MANTSKTFFDSFDGNASSEVNTIETKANAGLVRTSCTTQTLRLTSLIHKHCYITTKEEKNYTTKTYFCKYYPPQDPKGHYALTVRLQGYLRKHNIKQSTKENNCYITTRNQEEKSIQDLYKKFLAKKEV